MIKTALLVLLTTSSSLIAGYLLAYFLILRSIRKQGGFTMFGVAFHAHPKPRFKSSFIGIPKAIREATRQQDND